MVTRIAALPATLGKVAHALATEAASAGLSLSLASHAGLGLTDASVTGEHETYPAFLAGVRERLAGSGATAVVRDHPGGAGLDLWGPAPDAAPLMASVKASLDPAGILAPDRFAPWW